MHEALERGNLFNGVPDSSKKRTKGLNPSPLYPDLKKKICFGLVYFFCLPVPDSKGMDRDESITRYKKSAHFHTVHMNSRTCHDHCSMPTIAQHPTSVPSFPFYS